MRSVITQRLVDAVSAVDGRVLEPHLVTVQTQKPLLMVRMGAQEAKPAWSPSVISIEVWPYVDKVTFQDVDVLATAVLGALEGARLHQGSDQYLVHYEGDASSDLVSQELDGLTRGLSFRVYPLGWQFGLTYEPDPVAALQGWTEATFPGAVDTDPQIWAPSNVKPSIYWRLSALQEDQVTAAVLWLRAQLYAHILAPDASERADWCRRIAEALARRPRIYLSDDGPLLLEQVLMESDEDPMRTGQIRLQARFGLLSQRTPAPVLNQPKMRLGTRGEVTTAYGKDTVP